MTTNIVKFNREKLKNKDLIELEMPNTILYQDDEIKLFGKVENSKVGAIDEKGNIVIPYKYDLILPFEDKFTVARKNDKFGVIDIKNKIIIPFNYDKITPTFAKEKHYFIVKKQGNFGVINKKSNIIVPIKYKCVISYYNTALDDMTFTTDKHSVYNSKGEMIVKRSESLPIISSDVNIVSIKGIPKEGCVYGCDYGCVDENGKEIIPFKYTYSKIQEIAKEYKNKQF